MPDLRFAVETAEAVPFAAAPLLVFKVRIANTLREERVHSIALNCQVRIEPAARRYRPEEQAPLHDLFGEPSRWGQTLRSLLWTHTQVLAPSFVGGVVVDLPAPCTFDFNVAATKYFHALEDGEAPLRLLFSGTVFHEADDGALQVAPIPWDREAPYRLPVRVWKEMMDHYYPNTAWLNLHRDVFDKLYRFKVGRGLATWEQTLEALLSGKEGAS